MPAKWQLDRKKRAIEENNMKRVDQKNILFEKLDESDSSKTDYYLIYVQTYTTFDCHGILLRSNKDQGQYSAIETESLPFTLNKVDVHEDGKTFKGISGSIGEARGFSFDLIQTQNITAWGKSVKKETKLVIEEKTNILQWPDDT